MSSETQGYCLVGGMLVGMIVIIMAVVWPELTEEDHKLMISLAAGVLIAGFAVLLVVVLASWIYGRSRK